MTILMAYKLQDGVVLTADQKRSDLSMTGENLGGFRLVKKVKQIHPHMIIATAGLGDLGSATLNLLRSIIGINEEITVSSALQCVSDTFLHNYNLFKEINIGVTYLDLVAIIGGYDLEREKPYLFTISSKDDFKLTEQEGNYIRIGPGTNILDEKVNEDFQQWKDYSDIISTFSSAIRKVDSVDVSKNTFSIASIYSKKEGYLTTSVTVNEEGEIAS